MPDTEEDASVEAEAEEEVPEAADIRDSLIVSGDSILFDYPWGSSPWVRGPAASLWQRPP